MRLKWTVGIVIAGFIAVAACVIVAGLLPHASRSNTSQNDSGRPSGQAIIR